MRTGWPPGHRGRGHRGAGAASVRGGSRDGGGWAGPRPASLRRPRSLRRGWSAGRVRRRRFRRWRSRPARTAFGPGRAGAASERYLRRWARTHPPPPGHASMPRTPRAAVDEYRTRLLGYDPIFASALGNQQVLIRPIEERKGVVLLGAVLRHPSADGQVLGRHAVPLVGIGAVSDLGQHAFGDVARCLQVALRHNDAKLVPAVADQHVGLAGVPLDALRQMLDDAVAHRVAEGVVDDLEVIQVEHDQRQGRFAAGRAAELTLEMLLEEPVVVEA